MSPGIGPDHRLGAALVASIGLHAAALTLSVPAPQPALFETPLLQVRLVETPPAATIERHAPAPKILAPVERAPRKREPVPLVESAPRPPAPPELTPPQEAPAPLPEPVAAAPSPPPVVARAAVPRAPAPELLAAYGKTLSAAIARYKEYPLVARMRGWEGSVTMRLRVAPSGRLIGAELHASSGYDVLDQQALAMATRAKELPVPPDGLRDGEVVVLVPVLFRLER